MKKTLACLLVVASTFQMARAQGGERAVMKGQNSINLYYGVSLLGSVYKSAYDAADVTDVKVSQLGPLGLVYEHMVTDVVGLGAEIGYSQTKISYLEQDIDIFTGTSGTYHWDYQWTTIRAQIRANFHFAKSENFDAYALVSAGYRNTSFTFTTDSPYSTNYSWGGFFPFGIKPGIGLRYFFTDNIGLHVEFAAGTPLLCGGLSLRF